MNSESFIFEQIEFELGENKIEIDKKYPQVRGLVQITGIPNVYETNKDIVTISSLALDKIAQRKKFTCLITVTQSHNYFLPGLSSLIIDKLNLSNKIYCIDINQGCSGFAHALYMSHKLLDDFENIVILCADKYRSKLSNSDRSTNAVFSDCSSATLIKKVKKGLRINRKNFIFDGNKWGYLYQKINKDLNDGCLHMSGAELWTYTRSSILPMIEDMAKTFKYDNLYLHQASKVVFDGISSKIKSYIKNIPSNYEIYGNTVSSSIPLLLKNRLEEINTSKSLIAGFGVGLNAMLLELTVET
jgi:3-oxoacyl-[acyl-carrier-protein] synthase-3